MNMEQTGSASIQPKFWMRREEMMTPTLPRVSARMCRKIPTRAQGRREREEGEGGRKEREGTGGGGGM